MPIEVAPDPLAPTERLPGPPVLYSASDFREHGRLAAGQHPPSADDWVRALAVTARTADLLFAVQQKSPVSAAQLADAASKLPAAGDEFAGFRLIRELGRGTFGRVFLAEQIELAGRTVVVKITPDARTEVKLLARLLHTC